MATVSLTYNTKLGSAIQLKHGSPLLASGYSVSCYSNSTNDNCSASSTFNFPSLDGAKTSIIDSIRLSITTSISTGATGGMSLDLVCGESSFSFNVDNGNLSAEGIAYLNAYKAQHGRFPSAILRYYSWVSRPPVAEDGSTQVYQHIADFKTISIGMTFQGGVLNIRPVADVSVEHEIPSGFTGVYQLVDEEVADDDTTCIGCAAEANMDDDVRVSNTSVVSFDSIDFSEKRVVAVNIVGRHKIIGNSGSLGNQSVEYSVVFDNNTASYSDDTISEYMTCDKCVAPPSSEIVTAINSTVKNTKIFSGVQLGLRTSAHSHGTALKEGSKSAAYITQAYLVVYYEDDVGLGIYKTINGAWTQAQCAYQKQNGVWVEISEEECKSIISTSLCGK